MIKIMLIIKYKHVLSWSIKLVCFPQTCACKCNASSTAVTKSGKQLLLNDLKITIIVSYISHFETVNSITLDLQTVFCLSLTTLAVY